MAEGASANRPQQGQRWTHSELIDSGDRHVATAASLLHHLLA